MNQRTEFGEMLQGALREAGFLYFGKINLTEEEFNSYRDLSPRQIAEKYAKEHNLKEKGKILIILKEIYNNNKKNILTFSYREKMEEIGLDYKYYLFLLRHAPSDLFRIEGLRAQTRWIWTADRQPIFSDAEYYFDLCEYTKKYQINPQHRKQFEKYPELNGEELAILLKITDPKEKLAFWFKHYGIMRVATNREKRKYNKKQTEEKPQHEITSVETRRLPDIRTMNKEAKAKENGVQAPPAKEQETENLLNMEDQEIFAKSELLLMSEKLKYYKFIIQNQETYQKFLEVELRKYIKKYNKLKKKFKLPDEEQDVA